jgi:hypothetical protein
MLTLYTAREKNHSQSRDLFNLQKIVVGFNGFTIGIIERNGVYRREEKSLGQEKHPREKPEKRNHTCEIHQFIQRDILGPST